MPHLAARHSAQDLRQRSSAAAAGAAVRAHSAGGAAAGSVGLRNEWCWDPLTPLPGWQPPLRLILAAARQHARQAVELLLG